MKYWKGFCSNRLWLSPAFAWRVLGKQRCPGRDYSWLPPSHSTNTSPERYSYVNVNGQEISVDLGWGHTSGRSTYVATHIIHDGRCWGHHTARVNLAENNGGRMQLAICCHEKTWGQWDIHGRTQTTAKTTKRWSTVKDETAVIQEDNRIRQVKNVKLAPVWPAPFEGTQSCDVTQQGSTCVLA
jgi:hypothetical protein